MVLIRQASLTPAARIGHGVRCWQTVTPWPTWQSLLWWLQQPFKFVQKVVTEAVRDSRNLPLICQLQIATRGLATRDGVHTDARACWGLRLTSGWRVVRHETHDCPQGEPRPGASGDTPPYHNITHTAGKGPTRRGASSREVLRNGSLYSVAYQSDFRLISAVSKSAILCVPISVLISLEKRPIFRNSGFRYSGIGFPKYNLLTKTGFN